jgi:hypothetical protein
VITIQNGSRNAINLDANPAGLTREKARNKMPIVKRVDRTNTAVT